MAVPFSVVCILFAISLSPAAGVGGTVRALDAALLAVVLLTALQTMPLPAALTAALSPHDATVRRALALDGHASFDWLPLSIDPRATAWASVVTAGAFALFVAARTLLSRAGLRQTVRGICAMGLGCAALAISQSATAGRNIYWRFPTEYEGPLPFGPFVNRNHFATWTIMAVPLCLGYLAARVGSASSAPLAPATQRTRIRRLADGRAFWLIAAAMLMSAALVMSLSRSGIVSLLMAFGVMAILTRGRLEWRRGVSLVVIAGLMVALAAVVADVPALAEKLGRSASGLQGRLRIWRDTLPVVRDFWLAGTGGGTYRTAMLYYQRSYREVQFNQAHNHYLQAAAEGGVLLIAPLMCALFALARRIRVKLASDHSGTYWIRAGAATGLLAVALQSLWETGLVLPANAALAAVLAAIAVHDRKV